MKKKVFYYIFLLLIMVSFAGCTESGTARKPETTSTVINNANTTQEIPINTEAEDVTPTVQITPAVTTSVKATPESTPEPTLKEFDVDDVIMQSTPDSSCFSEVGYDSNWEILIVKFRDSGSVYTYLDFPADEWDEFISAGSLGGWYNKHIKGRYEYERIS